MTGNEPQIVIVRDKMTAVKEVSIKRMLAEIAKLRSDIERIGRERDDMARAAQELQERLSRLEDDHK